MFGFGSKVVGIDFGEDTIKVAQSKLKGDTIKLDNFGITQTENIIKNGEIINKDLLIDKLKTLFKKEKIKANKVCFAISEENILHKKINLPNLSDEELELAVENKIETEFNINNIEDVVYSHEVIDKGQGEQNVAVNIIVVNRELRNDYMEVLKALGLKVIGAYFEGDILYKLTRIADPVLDTVGIIDIGLNNTKISVYKNQKLQYFRSIELGGRVLDEVIEEELTGDVIGFKEQNNLLDIPELDITITKLIDNIDRILNDYQIYNEDIERLYLTGMGLGQIENLDELTEVFKTRVKKINLSNKLEGNINHNIANKILLAIGLSLEKGDK